MLSVSVCSSDHHFGPFPQSKLLWIQNITYFSAKSYMDQDLKIMCVSCRISECCAINRTQIGTYTPKMIKDTSYTQ